MVFAQRLRERRKAAKVTQVELSEAVGYTKTAASTWERGLCMPPIDAIEEIALMLHTTATYLLGYSDNPDVLDAEQVKDSCEQASYAAKQTRALALTDEEYALLTAYRAAQLVYQQAVIDILLAHPKEE